MPGKNGTGPAGMGPMTGRMAGHCARNSAGRRNIVMMRGQSAGFGNNVVGLGRRNRFHITGAPGRGWFGGGASLTGSGAEAEEQALKTQAEYLQSRIQAINKRLEELTAMRQDK